MVMGVPTPSIRTAQEVRKFIKKASTRIRLMKNTVSFAWLAPNFTAFLPNSAAFFTTTAAAFALCLPLSAVCLRLAAA